MRKHLLIAKILVFIALIFGTVAIFNTSNKIIRTSMELLRIYDDISFYNEQPRKTDEMTRRVEVLFEVRNELYHSKDTVVREFSNLPSVFKACAVIVMLFAQPAMIYMWFVLIVREIVIVKRRIERRNNSRREKRNRRVA